MVSNLRDWSLTTYLVFIELVEGFGFNLLDCVVLAGGDVLSLVDFGILLSRTQKIDLFEVLFSKHVVV